jgi:hypothetical protein
MAEIWLCSSRRSSVSSSGNILSFRLSAFQVLTCTFVRNSFAAAAGTAWYGRQTIVNTAQNSQLWVTSHLEFVGVLWKATDLKERLEELLDLEENNVQFFW